MKPQQTKTEEDIRAEQELVQQIQLMEENLRKRLTREALLRYGNIKAANPETAIKILVAITGYINRTNIEIINDRDFKTILKKIIPKKRDIRITRK